MPLPLPTEDEIRRAARELGIADEHGNYPRSQRNRLARIVQLAREQETDSADPHTGTTAQVLGRLAGELHAAGITPESTSAVLAEAARWLLDSRGLQLETREETTPS
ncbi:hypothetical protein IU501_23065 [Nocardia otitidiscaviarum]|uniref:hypothetical protein n=1 Tax=Nocardia otitidiscaviarum TaxID=1823 RepID=UPI0018933AF7|nr:hypothetical protein [Nocardia otitidiscaviarum]MBF6135876.1 hypothetical protein [Nocardia otitidiscaviarum]